MCIPVNSAGAMAKLGQCQKGQKYFVSCPKTDVKDTLKANRSIKQRVGNTLLVDINWNQMSLTQS